MAEKFKLDDHGKCPSCEKVSIQGQHVRCFTCRGFYHAVCDSAGQEEKVATKTTIANFLLQSTKKNFVFYCDGCLTRLEIKET